MICVLRSADTPKTHADKADVAVYDRFQGVPFNMGAINIPTTHQQPDACNASLVIWTVPPEIGEAARRQIDGAMGLRLGAPNETPLWVVVDEIPANAYAYAALCKRKIPLTSASSVLLQHYGRALAAAAHADTMDDLIRTLARQSTAKKGRGTHDANSPAGLGLRVRTIAKMAKPNRDLQHGIKSLAGALAADARTIAAASLLLDHPDPWADRRTAGFKLFVLHQDGYITPHPPVTL
jgi:hypothetical protein